MQSNVNIPKKTIRKDALKKVINNTESTVLHPYSSDLFASISKLGLRKGYNYLEIGPGHTRMALIAAMMGLNAVIFENSDDVISYQENMVLPYKNEIQNAGGTFTIKKLDTILAEQYEEYYEYENKFDFIVCLNFKAESDDLAELVGHIRYLGKTDFIVFTCMWKVPIPEIPDLIIKTFHQDVYANLIKFNIIHTDLFTSEYNPFLRNGVIAKVLK